MSFNTPLRASVRHFGTCAIRNQIVKPPLQIFGLEGKYASAAYSAASKQKQLDSVEKELNKFQGAMAKDVVLRDFMLNPVIKRSLKVKAVNDISKKLSFGSVSSNLLTLLAENGRLKNFNGIANAFNKIMSVYRGDLLCEVTSAKPLDDSTKQELQSTLKKFGKKTENIVVSWKVDPTVLGGLVVSIGDKYVDMSIASKVKKYTDILKGAAA